MSIPTITHFDAVPVRGMNEREFDEAALSFFPKLAPFSEDLQNAIEWMDGTLKASNEAYQQIDALTRTVVENAGQASASADAANRSAERAEAALVALPAGTLDDGSTAPDKAWSAQKISTELGNIGAILDEINGEVA